MCSLREDADVLSLECDNKEDPVEIVKLFTKPNSFRKTAIEKEKAISELKEEMTKLEMIWKMYRWHNKW